MRTPREIRIRRVQDTMQNRMTDFLPKQIQSPKTMAPKKRVLISYGVDVDAVAGWLGSYGGEDSINDISRGGFSWALLY